MIQLTCGGIRDNLWLSHNLNNLLPWRSDGLLSNHRVSTVFDLRSKIGLFVTFMDTFFTVLGLMGCLELRSNSTTRTAVRLSGAPHVSLIDFNCFTSQRKIFYSCDENSESRTKNITSQRFALRYGFSAGRDLNCLYLISHEVAFLRFFQTFSRFLQARSTKDLF